jgi:hypothetical protein
MRSPFTTIESPSTWTSPGKLAVRGVVPRQVRIGVGIAEIVDADDLDFARVRLPSYSARSTLRPMRPYPLMPTLIAMVLFPQFD